MEEESIEELSPRAEIFRSKLIEDFQLLDSLSSKSANEPPRFYSNEIQDPVIMQKLLKESPHGLVKFQMCPKREEIMFKDRRLNRVRNKNRIPFGPWAHSVIESQKIQNFIMFLIIANSVVLGIQAEITHQKGPTITWFKVILNVFDYITLVVFVLEILIKWIDGFWIFWRNGWNIFDFFVTTMSIVPEVMKLASGGQSSNQISIVGENMRVFKILRSLKMVSRFAQLRIIVLTILKAFKSMAFILMLLVLFMYIFAVAGTVVFDSYSKSDRPDLKYKDSFSTLKNALITLFQLFTLDHWYEILNDLSKVINPLTAKIYIISWICIGAFIVRNIFTGIMVNNFQNIRNEFNQQIKEQIAVKEQVEVRNQLTEELDKQDKKQQQSRRTSSIAPPEKNERRKSSFLEKIFHRKTSVAINVIKEEPIKEKQEEPVTTEAQLQPQFVTTLQQKIAQIRSKDDNIKPTQSFHAYYDKKEIGEKKEDETESGQHATKLSEQGSKKGESSEVSEKKDYQPKQMGTEDLKTTDPNEFTGWEKTVEANLHNFERFPMETLWPRDTLFKYFQLMESLQENLLERKQLMRLLVEAQLQFHDSEKKR